VPPRIGAQVGGLLEFVFSLSTHSFLSWTQIGDLLELLLEVGRYMRVELELEVK
jgi:hypothetical protein